MHIRDLVSNNLFLIDTGAAVSVIPKEAGDVTNPSVQQLRAANGTPIAAYGRKSLTLNLGLRRTFRWMFIVADVPYPILGIDFLDHFDLLIDARGRRVVDRQTSLSVTGSYSSVNHITPLYIEPQVEHPCADLLSAYPAMLRQSGPLPAVTTNVSHHIVTKGPPAFSRPRRLTLDELRVA